MRTGLRTILQLSVLATFALVNTAPAQSAEKIKVEARQVQFALLDPGATAVGELVCRGG